MAQKKVDFFPTSFATQIDSACYAGLADNNGFVILGWYNSSLTTLPKNLASTYSPGCIMVNTNGSGTSTSLVVNAGTTAVPAFTVLNIN